MAKRTVGGRPAPSVFPLARTSTVDLIAQELRNAIYSGALPVGSALREVEISSQLGVSRSPLREAAQRLVQEGLLTAVPGRGLRISQIVGDAIEDVYTARLAIEAQAIRMVIDSIAAGKKRPLLEIQLAFETLVEESEGDDAWAIGDADLAFHQILVDQAASLRLSRAMTTLATETRLASLSVSEGYTVRRSISPTYHALLSALEEGDAQAAIDALAQQFTDAVRRLGGDDDSFETVETEIEDEPQQLQPLETSGLMER